MSKDFDFHIVTRNNDFGEDKPYPGIQADEWIQKDGYRIKYLSQEKLTYAYLKEEVRSARYDRIYLNSFFSKSFTLWPLWAARKEERKKIILAPRGMLGEGALALKSGRKKIFLKAVQFLGLYKDIDWHASTILEEKEIKAVFPKAKVTPLENLPAIMPAPLFEVDKKAGELKLVFLSRISPKKNLAFLLDRLIEIGEPGIHLDVYGPDEDEEYSKLCKEKAEQVAGEVRFLGTVPYESITATFQPYHAFALPTLSENFGHVILEALNASLPILISDQTPWLNLQEKGVGRDLSLNDMETWKQVLIEWLQSDQEAYGPLRKAASQFAQSKFANAELEDGYKRLFSNSYI
ncbi:glycosyltransferase [bacterium SCSIO 12741]|nr:glycosyltransferase [bacterium SCSIO 12741]